MIVAEVIMLTRSSVLSAPTEHRIRFDNLDNAKAEYERVAALALALEYALKQKYERANVLPEILEVIGTVNRVSFPLEILHSVTLLDFSLANEHEQGLREAFPALFQI